MASVFSKIVNGEISCHRILEDDKFIAFLDISPLAEGHTLVIPKKETDYIFDIGDSELAEFMCFAKKVASKIKNAIDCTRIGITVIGLEVPHAHIHLIPINGISDMNFERPKLDLSSEELKQIAERIVLS
jgi:histidine triad (HIT) family protein